MEYRTEVLVDGLAFPEGPRWHEGRLWFSDMNARKVHAVSEDGALETICTVPARPSGLGWWPEDGAADAGRLLVVSMDDRRLLRLDPEGLVEVADLSPVASCHCNDMVVSSEGRAYVGNFGFDIHSGEGDVEPQPATLALVERDGRVRPAAENLMFPNGCVITPDGSTLIVCETFSSCLTAFTIQPDGSLDQRRTWAEVPGIFPDGCCLDADGGIWVATVTGHQVLRLIEGGEVTDRVVLETESFACMLGGEDGRSLFVCTASTSHPEESLAAMGGRIEVARVASPRAGRP
jgi:sugar lactone lactonase YvrE